MLLLVRLEEGFCFDRDEREGISRIVFAESRPLTIEARHESRIITAITSRPRRALLSRLVGLVLSSPVVKDFRLDVITRRRTSLTFASSKIPIELR